MIIQIKQIKNRAEAVSPLPDLSVPSARLIFPRTAYVIISKNTSEKSGFSRIY